MNHTANGTSGVLFSWFAFKPASVWMGKLDVRALISENWFCLLAWRCPKDLSLSHKGRVGFAMQQ